jgi:hypothetical protein
VDARRRAGRCAPDRRQALDGISSEIAIHTEHNTDDIKKLVQENTDLTKAVKANTDLFEEIHRHLTALGPPED